MAIKATPLHGWESYVPEFPGNDGDDPVRCECRPLSSELESCVIRSIGKIDVELQRNIVMTCVRNIENYLGTNGQPVTSGAELINYGGQQGARVIFSLVAHVTSLSFNDDDIKKSAAPSASSST